MFFCPLQRQNKYICWERFVLISNIYSAPIFQFRHRSDPFPIDCRRRKLNCFGIELNWFVLTKRLLGGFSVHLRARTGYLDLKFEFRIWITFTTIPYQSFSKLSNTVKYLVDPYFRLQFVVRLFIFLFWPLGLRIEFFGFCCLFRLVCFFWAAGLRFIIKTCNSRNFWGKARLFPFFHSTNSLKQSNQPSIHHPIELQY